MEWILKASMVFTERWRKTTKVICITHTPLAWVCDPANTEKDKKLSFRIALVADLRQHGDFQIKDEVILVCHTMQKMFQYPDEMITEFVLPNVKLKLS